jgi:hypothetical protein
MALREFDGLMSASSIFGFSVNDSLQWPSTSPGIPLKQKLHFIPIFLPFKPDFLLLMPKPLSPYPTCKIMKLEQMKRTTQRIK